MPSIQGHQRSKERPAVEDKKQRSGRSTRFAQGQKAAEPSTKTRGCHKRGERPQAKARHEKSSELRSQNGPAAKPTVPPG